MIRTFSHDKMGSSDLGWLKSLFHFSFSSYYNPDNIRFGALRVVNDDLVQPKTGFDTHPHQDMEIISYVIDGALTHGDSMGNQNTLTRGQVQYMNAGTGVWHSEHNRGDEALRFLQIWILPDQTGYEPNYGDHAFIWADRKNQWLHLVSAKEGDAPIRINQDANIFVTELEAEKHITFQVKDGRQAYLVQIEGSAEINGHELTMRDALASVEESLEIKAIETSHLLVIEMAQGS